jgi:hypothetical protein
MAVEPSTTQVLPTAGPAASNRIGGGGRASASEQIEGASGSPFINLADQWRTGNDAGLSTGLSTSSQQQQQTANQWLRGQGTPILFTPLVSLAAASYPAGATFQEENSFQSPLAPSELQRAVGVYEYCMRVTSGSTADQGKVVNRFS